jgi:hypothetical protein
VKIAHKIIALDATKPPERGLEQGRQHEECEELRGSKHAELARPCQHDQPDHSDQLV